MPSSTCAKRIESCESSWGHDDCGLQMINVAALRRKRNLSAVEYWTKLPTSLPQTHCWPGTGSWLPKSMMALPSEDPDGHPLPENLKIWSSAWHSRIGIGDTVEFSVPCSISDTPSCPRHNRQHIKE